ncbi:MAG: SPASM domain-containing protein [Firmicutes bacterium]|nr:SPASM domain-containing protein [Candidatus Fermentithermobacillaceae bacterium]
MGPDGTLYPCMVFRKPIGNLRDSTFDALWDSAKMKMIRELREEHIPCYSCAYQDHCEFCPGEVWNLTRTMTSQVSTLCRIGRACSEVRSACPR